MGMMTRPALAFALALVASLIGGVRTPATGATGPSPQDGTASIRSDFNGDGWADLAIGAPTEDIGAIADAGVVHVLHGSPGGLRAKTPADQLWSQQSPDVDDKSEAGDQFGAALAAGDFNGDGKGDLAIGSPFEDVKKGGSTPADAGMVQVLYGSASGLQATSPPDQLFVQGNDAGGVVGYSDQNDHFGAALAVGDFDGDGLDDLAVGVPGESRGALENGFVNVLYGSPSGLVAEHAGNWFDQNSNGVEDQSEAMDHFGAALATGDFNGDGRDDLAAGVPGEDLAQNLPDVGAVNVIHGSPSGLSATAVPDQFWTQDSPSVEEQAEAGDQFGTALGAGDFNGDGRGDLAIGAPWEDTSCCDEGVAHVIYGSSAGLSATAIPDQLWQNAAYIAGSDRYGSSFAVGDFGATGFQDLAVGVSWQLVDLTWRGGAVEVVYGSASGLSTADHAIDVWTQNSPNVEDDAETNDWFSWSVMAANFGGSAHADLAVGVYQESFGEIEDAGAVNVIYGSSGGLSATVTPDQLWSQDSPGVEDAAEAYDGFGTSLA